MNYKEKALKRIEQYDEMLELAKSALNDLNLERSDFIEANKELFAPVKIGQQIMYQPTSHSDWGKVEILHLHCDCFPHRWNAQVKLLDIPQARNQEGKTLWISITDGGSDWKTIEE